MSQFAFLQAEFSPVYDHARKAEIVALSDPRTACFYARLALETAVKWMYERDKALRTPYDDALSALIHEPTFRAVVGDALVTKARIIKDLGNRAVHDTRVVAPQSATTALRELFHFSYWFVRTYAKGAKPDAGIQFSADALPRTAHIEATTLARLQEVAKRFVDQAKAHEAAEAAAPRPRPSAPKSRPRTLAFAPKSPPSRQANATTRRHSRLQRGADPRRLHRPAVARGGLAARSTARPRIPESPACRMNSRRRLRRLCPVGRRRQAARPRRSQTHQEGRPRRPAAGQTLCRLSGKAAYGQRPIIFYTNGYEHWIWDDASYPPRSVQGFLKKDELLLLHQRRDTRRPLAGVETDTAIAGRFYQTRAIRRIDEAFEKDHQRKALLVMATGSGKTRTVIALIDQLMRANWVKRALFLADRVALVRQAVGAFKTHMPYAAPVNLVTDKQTEGRLYVSTYPTMVGLIDEIQNGVRRFGSGHFDLIVIDEAHRSVYRKYKAIFDYFDSLLVGLTATPRDEIDRDTYSLFELERGVPTDSYDLDEAVADGFLVPPKAVSVPLRFQREGIRYDDLSDEEKEAWDALEWMEDGDVPESVDASAVNKWLFNADTVDKVLEHVMTHGLKVEEGDRLGKTIIFAKNSKHAQFIAERFDANYPHLKGHFARVIDYQTTYAQSLIDDFSNPDKAAAHRHFGRYARHRHRCAGSRQSRFLQDRPLKNQVLADDRPWHAPQARLVRPWPPQGTLPCLRLLPEFRVFQSEPNPHRGSSRGFPWCQIIQGPRRVGRRDREKPGG